MLKYAIQSPANPTSGRGDIDAEAVCLFCVLLLRSA
jgi:hypothetical protein